MQHLPPAQQGQLVLLLVSVTELVGSWVQDNPLWADEQWRRRHHCSYQAAMHNAAHGPCRSCIHLRSLAWLFM